MTENEKVLELVKELLVRQEEQSVAFDEFKEDYEMFKTEVLEKLDNVGVPGSGFSEFGV